MKLLSRGIARLPRAVVCLGFLNEVCNKGVYSSTLSMEPGLLKPPLVADPL